MSHQDLKPQSFNFSGNNTNANARPKKLTEAQASRAMQSGGNVEVTKKMGPGNHHGGLGKQAKVLDDDTESTKVKHVAFNLRIAIQKGRQAKEWTQQDLARAISEKKEVVTEYENGKAVPNEQIIQKMEKALGVHLRGVKAGEPLAKKPAAKKA